MQAKFIRVASKRSKNSARAIVESFENRRLLSVALDAGGFTVVTPSPDSQLIYVSASGSDINNTGLSPSSPLATLATAYGKLRNGFPDWILLNRGDTFNESFGDFADSGRSKQEPAVVTDYGDPTLARPVVDAGANNAFVTSAANQHVDIIGISFTSSTHNPSSPNFTGQGMNGFYDLGGTTDLLIEDCSFSYFTFDLTFTANYGPVNDITVRRSEILDAYSNNATAHSQGLYAEMVTGLNIQDNVFDHDGWNAAVVGAQATIYNHDCYLHSSDNNVVVTGNIFADASSFGLQARSGGIVDDNVFINDPHAFSFGLVNGATTRAGGVSGEVVGNVVLGARQDPSGWGFGAVIGNLKVGGATVISNNIFADGGGSLAAINLQPGTTVVNPQQEVGLNSVVISDNVVYNWGYGLLMSPLFVPGSAGADGLSDVVIRDNDFQDNAAGRIISHGSLYDPRYETWSGNVYSSTTSSASNWFQLQGANTSFSAWQAAVEPTAVNAVVPFVDPARSVMTYMAGQGLTPTLAAFISGARDESAALWDPLYLASTIAAYIQDGFTVAAGNTGGVSGSVTTAAAVPVAGVTVYVDIDKSGTLNAGDISALTDSSGAYAIANIPAGAQTVRQVLPNGGAQLSPLGGAGLQVIVAGGGSLSNENFVDSILTTGAVSGAVTTAGAAPVVGATVYVDMDNSGTFNAGDPFATTNAVGVYAIGNVPAGPRIIRQVLAAGDTQSSPTGGSGIQITVVAGGSLANNNFVDALPTSGAASVSGAVKTTGGAGVAGVTVYVDANNNGKLDPAEQSAVTASTGAYNIANVSLGAMIARQILPPGDAQTTPAGGYGIHITVTGGASVTGENFTDTVPAATSNKGSVGGFVKTTAGKAIVAVTIYLDANNNGKLDSGEFSSKTDSTGAYSLSGIPAGATILRQIVPSGDKQTAPGGGLGIHITIKAGGTLKNQNFIDAASK
ncbi:MAG TPA: carboxypeptidase-like regulatory domain-containing protein [Tepidisphaeraceae bacterium]|nr:carboxypeptidase-like regulatory domain-containing protein [Tepidisphaeraceae bacterium]